ncbi:MAG: CpXC domain-containing protein [Alphaproteobacteria bacterium]|nr:CpXC domain-containing protein [Alphaproteobacteria bacterium]
MSIFHARDLPCPRCGELVTFPVSDSVNAERRPDLREAILDNSFQAEACPACGESFRVDPGFTYFDPILGLWIHAKSLSELTDWPAAEADTAMTWMISYGIVAPPPVQELGEWITPRVTFGWAALREKILAKLAGIDDATLELAKVGVFEACGREVWSGDLELRLSEVDGDTLIFAWLKGPDEALDSVTELPAAYLDDVEADPEAFAALRAQIVGEFFVDLNRALVVLDEDAPEEPEGEE